MGDTVLLQEVGVGPEGLVIVFEPGPPFPLSQCRVSYTCSSRRTCFALFMHQPVAVDARGLPCQECSLNLHD
jgi:hypothetical protein